MWLSGRGELWFEAEAQDRIDLIPESKRVAPGENARLQVRMPFRRATMLVTVEREGIVDSRVIELVGSQPSFELPIKAEYGPNVFVSVLPIREQLARGAVVLDLHLGLALADGLVAGVPAPG